ncbi:MAG: hypothetical protein KGP01_04705 [Actinomycetales bacterium]|nr:hypothetical protein [Actinomycetales bacterium]
MDASGAVLITIAAVEVLVRNALDAALLRWSRRRGHQDWLDSAPLDAGAKSAIAAARMRHAHAVEPASGDRPIAELGFGFWRYLVTYKYLTSLWVPCLRHAFPAGIPDSLDRREQVHMALQRLVYVRNRAAHHEPIHNRNLMQDYDTAVELGR